MTETTNYKLKKPGYEDYVDIGALNANADVIDEELHKLKAGKSDTVKPSVEGNLAALAADGKLQDSGRKPGEKNGVATLDENGHIPGDQLPNSFLPLKGGTMSGPINMNGQRITGLPKPAGGNDPMRKDDGASASTLGLYGLSADGTVDNVLAYVGKYAQHWWKRTKKIIKKSDSKERNISYSDESGTATECNISYSSNISVSDGSLVSPVNITVSYTHQTSVLNGKYFIMTTAPKGDTDLDESKMYFGQSSVKTKSSGGIYYTYITCQLVSIETYEPEYVHSSSRSAYPDSGEQGGYEYQYLGIPFENAATAPKIATGSYVGTGKYGSNNPNSLTFEFDPKLVLIFTGAEPAIFLTSRLTKSFSGTKVCK